MSADTTVKTNKRKKHRLWLVARLTPLMSPGTLRHVKIGLRSGITSGILQGLALAILLPAATALATGQPTWGLTFWQWFIALAVVTLIFAFFDYTGTKHSYIGGLGFMRETQLAIGDKAASLPLGWFDGESAGMLSRMVTQEMMNLGQMTAFFASILIKAVGGAGVVAILSWLWDWRLGLMLVISIPFYLFFVWLAGHLVDRGHVVDEVAEAGLAARIVEFVRCQGALRACHAGETYGLLDAAFNKAQKSMNRGLLLGTIGQFLSGTVVKNIVMGLVVLGGELVLGGHLTPVEGLVVIGLSLRYTSMLEDINSNVCAIEDRRQMVERVEVLLETPSLKEVETSAPMTSETDVVFDKVDFGYLKDQTVLDGLSFTVPAGTMCAIVGPSGCGKTTIIRLISRFYDVRSGSIRIAGQDIRQVRLEDLMQRISPVFQDVYLFDDTLEANIRIADEDATKEELERVAALAGVTEIITRLPDGWQTRCGEGGRALSGGERQRVSIARALLKKAPLVLFDEATSALDAENEANIVRAMEELRKTSTLIVVAHKLETIRKADQVIVLDDHGHIAEQGRHEELLANDGPYKKFWQHRYESEGWSLL